MLRWAVEAACKAGTVDPQRMVSRQETLPDAIAAYEAFDRRRPGWLKVALTV